MAMRLTSASRDYANGLKNKTCPDIEATERSICTEMAVETTETDCYLVTAVYEDFVCCY